MEAYITPPDAFPHSDPLTRLLAAILEWLRALLAAHEAGLLPSNPTRRASARKTAEPSAQSTLTAETPARTPAPTWTRTRAVRPCDMSAGIPRPRLVAPH